MSPADYARLLGVVCGLGAIGAVGAYIWVVLRRKRWLNSAGLLLTGLGIMQLSLLLQGGATIGSLINATLTVALFIAAIVVQTIAAVRGRSAWDGSDRRGNP